MPNIIKGSAHMKNIVIVFTACFIFSSQVLANDKITTFTTANGLGSNQISSVYVDTLADGKSVIYAGSQSGLSISQDEKEFKNYTFKTSDGLDASHVSKMYKDKKNKIYVLTSHALFISNEKGKKFKSYVTINELPGKHSYFNDLFVDQNGKIYIATLGDGLLIWENLNEKYKLRTTENGLANNIVYSVHIAGEKIYAGTDGGLSLSTNSGKKFTTFADTDGITITCLDNDKNGSLYAGTWHHGLLILKSGETKFTALTTSNKFISDHIHSINVDGDKVYVGTADGLAISEDQFKNTVTYTVADGLPSADVFGLSLGKSGVIFAATYAGLVKLIN
jgi:ligand-binding sensor domain-containing protein